MWLPWEYAVLFSAALAAAWAAVRGRHSLASACGEASWVFMLYAMWRWLNRVDLHLTGALGRGRWIWKLERRLGIGSERWFQRMVLSRPIVVQAANVFYATAHVTAMVVFLFWMFFRHRDRYAPWRSLLALSTAADVLLRLIPVAPPRLLPEFGFVDTAIRYKQSVFGAAGTGVSDQLAAMPSIHVGWAVLIGIASYRVSTSRWRYLGVIHAVVTCWVVTVTANHWWLDGVVAVALLWPLWLLRSLTVRMVGRVMHSVHGKPLHTAPVA